MICPRMFLVALVFVLPFSPATAQDPPVEWGEVSTADLAMSVFAPDSDAGALVLADYGQSQVNDELGITFTHHKRIKIFSVAGYEWGTHVVPLYSKDKEEILSHLEGATYSLRPDGSIQQTEMNNSAIFTEAVDENHSRCRFTLPALQPGCIIEFRYRITYRNWLVMPTWRFQGRIPTRWSEYRTLIPRTMSYAKVTFTYSPFAINESQKKSVHIGGFNELTAGDAIPCEASRWVMRDLPGLGAEPFITTMDDYTPQVRLQLEEYAGPSVGVKKVLKTWEGLIDELLDDKDFGDVLDEEDAIRELTRTVVADRNSPVDRMIAVYDYVRSTMVWNGEHSLFGTDPADLVQSKKGNSGDINFLLMAMLRSAGLDVSPVIASTRDHGRVLDIYPLVVQFNTVVALVRVAGVALVLDATDPRRPFDLIPPDLLNVAGLTVSKGPPQWISLASPRQYVHHSTARLELNERGEVRGVLTAVDDQYSALLQREQGKRKTPIDIANTAFDAPRIGLALDSPVVFGLDSSDGQVRVRANVALSPYAQSSGDHLYCTPVVLDRVSNNPFRLKERRFAVDMAYGRDVTSVTSLRFPAGFTVVEVPKDLAIGGDDIRYTRKIIAGGDSLLTETRLFIRVSIFPPEVYKSLQEFYETMIAAESEQVVLQRTP